MESNFDLLFALNGKTHPGEKCLIQLWRECCVVLPEDFEKNLTSLFSHMFCQTDAVAEDLDRILTELAKNL